MSDLSYFYSFQFGSQDVLIPWHKPQMNIGAGTAGSVHSGKFKRSGSSGSRKSAGQPTQLQHPPSCVATTGCATTTTTTTTSEDDVTHYYAYTQTTTSDSGDQFNYNKILLNPNKKI